MEATCRRSRHQSGRQIRLQLGDQTGDVQLVRDARRRERVVSGRVERADVHPVETSVAQSRTARAGLVRLSVARHRAGPLKQTVEDVLLVDSVGHERRLARQSAEILKQRSRHDSAVIEERYLAWTGQPPVQCIQICPPCESLTNWPVVSGRN